MRLDEGDRDLRYRSNNDEYDDDDDDGERKLDVVRRQIRREFAVNGAGQSVHPAVCSSPATDGSAIGT